MAGDRVMTLEEAADTESFAKSLDDTQRLEVKEYVDERSSVTRGHLTTPHSIEWEPERVEANGKETIDEFVYTRAERMKLAGSSYKDEDTQNNPSRRIKTLGPTGLASVPSSSSKDAPQRSDTLSPSPVSWLLL